LSAPDYASISKARLEFVIDFQMPISFIWRGFFAFAVQEH